MASLISKLKTLFPEVEERIGRSETPPWVLQNDSDGSGDYISEWNLDDPQPTAEQLEAADTDGDDLEALYVVRKQRRQSYPEIREQLDKMYHDGFDAWKDMIKVVKDEYPKP
tara:strand:- start:27 stop:362 length:336 start_codon:yes stop_codon:yes gene_type:complete